MASTLFTPAIQSPAVFRFLTFSTVHEIDYLNELTPDLIRNEFFLIKCHPGKVICTGPL